jgi:hypothetical protein
MIARLRDPDAVLTKNDTGMAMDLINAATCSEQDRGTNIGRRS